MFIAHKSYCYWYLNQLRNRKNISFPTLTSHQSTQRALCYFVFQLSTTTPYQLERFSPDATNVPILHHQTDTDSPCLHSVSRSLHLESTPGNRRPPADSPWKRSKLSEFPDPPQTGYGKTRARSPGTRGRVREGSRGRGYRNFRTKSLERGDGVVIARVATRY